MAAISFIAQGPGSVINNLAGSGLGFYGSAGFGASVAVGAWQGTTFVCDSTGTLQGPQCHNTQYLNIASGVLDSATSGVALTAFPNYMAPLNIRFNNGTAVTTQNVKLYIFDRTNINNAASGVTTEVAELRHPDTVQNNNGSGTKFWNAFDQSIASSVGSGMPFCPGPGVSGLYANGAGGWRDTEHDWYVALSASPDSIGAKTQYGLYFYLEYL